MKDVLTMSVAERLLAWRILDKSAGEAERNVARLGLSPTDYRIRELVLSAKTLREQSDSEFVSILQALKSD